VIARVFPGPRLAVHAGGDQAPAKGRAQQQVIDAQSGVAGKGVSEIFPEGVDPLPRVERPQRVGPALLDQAAIGIAHLRPEQRVIDPALRRIDVEIGRHHVEVAGENGRCSAVQKTRSSSALWQAATAHRFVKGQSGNSRGRPPGAKNMKTLLTKALNELVVVTDNGGRRKVSKREAIITQLVNRSAKADFKAIQILLGMIRDIESDTDPRSSDPTFTEADQQIIQRLQARFRGEKG
jgi:Family of unknown function (DUF5681)